MGRNAWGAAVLCAANYGIVAGAYEKANYVLGGARPDKGTNSRGGVRMSSVCSHDKDNSVFDPCAGSLQMRNTPRQLWRTMGC
jgi:hypothetical protein